jgi:superfamily II DNA or RNA helicase
VSSEVLPDEPGQRVRLVTDHSVTGVTTGQVKKKGPFVLVQIEIGPNNKPFKRHQHLELIPDGPEPVDGLIRTGRFGGARDLSRAIAYHKIRGDLTDVLYSMESSLTDFYAHQFKPVLKFIDSVSGRILIADEVGLGKTIEAIYIWKEVQAREHGQRLLIVCPSMLRHKWKSDLSRLFGIESHIFGAKDVLERLEVARSLPDRTPFVIIASYEGLRPRKDFDRGQEELKRPRERLARLLSEMSDGGEDHLLDLVVFDEAHNLRNEETQTHLLAKLLVDASKHTALLSATPVQTSSDNLFSLLRLLDPDHFISKFEFEEMLASNAPLVQAQQALWSSPPDLELVNECLENALESTYFESHPALEGIRREIGDLGSVPPAKRVELGRRLEALSLLGPYVTRTRKREVEANRVERVPTVLTVRFNDLERKTYSKVTDELRSRARGLSGFDLFPIIGRQREMTSSLPAAFRAWNEKEVMQDILWEDLGLVSELGDDQDDELSTVLEEVKIDQSLLQTLEADDSKYLTLREQFLKQISSGGKLEKVIIFAFFRGTLNYLAERLRHDGYEVAVIMGGQVDDRQATLEAFEDPHGPQILLSSEVGSEGIDLQFCRTLVNYDLPWNPMKLEQRIGRIDRLGQQSKRISIVNLVVEDTIEDKVLMRLYDRIEIFKESIGDLEEILGDVSESLQKEFFDPELSDEERDRRALEKELVIENNRKNQREVADQAINLVGFSDYLMEAVNETRELGRWVSAEEMLGTVNDFFEDHYPGTVIKVVSADPITTEVELSFEARSAMSRYIERNPARRSQLSRARRPIRCIFDPRKAKGLGPGHEAIDPGHPLIGWIQSEYEASDRSLHKAIALEVKGEDLGMKPGDYAFAVECWTLTGLRRECTMAYSGVGLSDMSQVDRTLMEKLVMRATRRGQTIPTQAIEDRVKESCADAFIRCGEILETDFGDRADRFYDENEARCDQQAMSAERLADRKIRGLEEKIANMRRSGKTRTIAANEGQVSKQREVLAERLSIINEKRDPDVDLTEIAGGLIRVLNTNEGAS